MKNLSIIIALVLMTVMLAACGETGDSRDDSASAETLQPEIVGFESRPVDNIIDAFSATAGTAALAGGNPALAAAIERTNTTLGCLQDVGALNGQIYERTEGFPQYGTSLIVNVDRVERNILNCVTEQPFSAQAIEIAPCFQTGEFEFEGDRFLYMYAGLGGEICAAFNTHFRTNLGATNTVTYP